MVEPATGPQGRRPVGQEAEVPTRPDDAQADEMELLSDDDGGHDEELELEVLPEEPQESEALATAHAIRSDEAQLSEADLASAVAEIAEPGDIVICLGAGTSTVWANGLPDALARLEGEAS